MELFDHQRKIIEDDPKKAPLALGTGSGKSRTALELARGRTLVVCLKQGREDRTWERNADRFGIVVNLKVISKEQFRRDHKKLPPCDTLIIDEAHTLLGVLPDTKLVRGKEVVQTSQLYAALRWYIDKHQPERLYFASATMIPKPMNLYALATLMGKRWDFFEFRKTFYFPVKMGWRTAWIPKKNKELKERLADLFKNHLGAYTGQLSDWFDVPEQTHTTVHFDLTKQQKEAIKFIKENVSDPMVARTKLRSIENGVLYTHDIEIITGKTERLVSKTEVFKTKKMDYILERAQEFKKMLIFANYTGQIEEIVKTLKKEGYDAVALTGKTKDRENLFIDADSAEHKIIVAQASISAGYEFKTCNCVIFASKSYKFVDYEQALGRVLRADAIKKNLYIHLVVKGGVDESCHKSIMEGKDFQEMIMNND